MNPPRWNSTNADLVRTELMRRVEEEPSPAGLPVTPVRSSEQRSGVLRLAVAVAIALAVIVPASVYAFSAGGRPQPVGGSTTNPSASASASSPTPTGPPVPTASAPAIASATCALAQLSITEPGAGGPTTGDWVQLLTVRNRGAACTLPASAFSLAGRSAAAGTGSRAGGFELPAGSTILLATVTNVGCGNGAGNTSVLGPNAKPIVVRLGTGTVPGLTERVPVVACANTQIDRIH